MRSFLLFAACGLLVCPATAQDRPSQADRDRVQACVALTRGSSSNGGSPIEESDAEGIQAHIKNAMSAAAHQAESCIGLIATPCQQTEEGQPNLGMAACLWRETAVWDERLNAAYKKRLEGAKPDYREALKKAQRAWIALRDAKCASISIGIEGSMVIPMEASCRLTETARQAIWLETDDRS